MNRKVLKRLAAGMCAVAVTAVTLGTLPYAKTEAKAVDNFSISVDGSKITNDSLRLGMVSANGSSRLLMDYKSQNETAYWELIDHLFSKDTGIGLTHLKLEMGSDVDSSSGSEPATKRSADEQADVTRGAGFQLAADVKSRYPDVSIDLLQWGEPNFAHQGYASRYQWYKETLDAAYDTYGLEFDYVSACPNESGVTKDNIKWIKYFKKALTMERTGRYDYSKIKLVAADEVTACAMAESMLKDEELLNAIDVLGIHYSTWSNDAAVKLKNEYGKDIWYSEGTAVATDPALGKNATTISGLDATLGDDGGLTGTNGTLEIAARVLNMYPQGQMTMYEFQPAISSYYYGSVYTPKQLITANTPWSGYYKVESGAAMAAHFTRFLTDDMHYVEGACYGDGEKNTATGDGHGLVNTTNNYITLADSKTGDYTMIFVNDSENSREYNISVNGLAKSDSVLSVWTTSGSTADTWLAKTGEITPVAGAFNVTIAPYSIVTLTTLSGQKSFSECQTSSYQDKAQDTVLSLPFYEDYNYDDSFLSARGGAPLYQTDVSGSFEVADLNGEKVLMQKVTYDERPYGWGGGRNSVYTNQSYTQVGDGRWSDYKVSADVYFDTNAAPATVNYTALGLRYTSSDSAGYYVKLYMNGKWQAVKGYSLLAEGGIDSFDATAVHKLKVKAVGNNISFYVDNALVYTVEDTNAPYTSGRIAMFSPVANNAFDNLAAEEVAGGSSYVSQIDALSDNVSYSGSWALKAGDSYKYNNRTRAVSGAIGDSFTTTFDGTGVNLVSGTGNAAKISVDIDGVSEEIDVPATGVRQASYIKRGLEDGTHTLTVTVLDGEYTLDTVESVCAVNDGEDADPDDQNELTAGIDIALADCADITDSFIYDGTEHYPTLPVPSYNGESLVEGVDYVVGYGDNVSAGRFSKVYFSGIGRFYGWFERTFAIDKRDITASSLSLVACYENGEPMFTLFDNTIGVKLLEGTDYTIFKYDSGIALGETGNITIKGRGSYTGAYETTFTMTDHSYNLIYSTAPTADADGENIYECEFCGSRKTETVPYVEPTEPTTSAPEPTEPTTVAPDVTEPTSGIVPDNKPSNDNTDSTAATNDPQGSESTTATVGESTTAASENKTDEAPVNTGAGTAAGAALAMTAFTAAAIAVKKRKR